MNLKIKETIGHILDALTLKTIRLAWNTGTAGGELLAVKCGKVVMLKVINPTQLAVGNNVICTLPVGWRPAMQAITVLVAPSATVNAHPTLNSLRLVVDTNGNVNIYNYRTSAITGNTNASGTITFITA